MAVPKHMRPGAMQVLLGKAFAGAGVGAQERHTIVSKAIDLGGFTPEERRMMSKHVSGSTRLENSGQLALSALKKKGLVDNDGAGSWRLTAAGRDWVAQLGDEET